MKLSALHPRYDYKQRTRVIPALSAKLLELAQMAKANQISMTVDAEEADRLFLQLDIFTEVIKHLSLKGWDGLGMVVQAYQKMASGAIDYLESLARETGHRIPVRLVKGAYWDTEIKHAQVEGYAGYPVFTRKANTDVSYIACAKRLLGNRQAFYPQFATHNAHTIASVSELAGDRLDFEYQRLHGMGEDLYTEVLKLHKGLSCRVYAPVGSHEDLLPYLVRRLLENGANTSFVNRIMDEKLPVEMVAEDPMAKVASTLPVAHPAIPLPLHLYGESRLNSSGMNLTNDRTLLALAEKMQPFVDQQYTVAPALAPEISVSDQLEQIDDCNPAFPDRKVADVRNSSEQEIEAAIRVACDFVPEWDKTPLEERARALEITADLLEENLPELMAMCVREAGKTILDSIAEVREAVDFCRYYAMMARQQFGQPMVMPGPTGEHNEISLHGRGVFVCISPWNFPLAIFVGQASAALVTGNTVLAKPAEQTPAIALRAVQLMQQAGMPQKALQLLTGGGAVGARLTSDPRVNGVVFTGSTETSWLINRSLAARDAPLAALIAETGGQNVMLVDSSALPEQVVKDVIGSAFLSAGQRCSALRVLYLQHDIADDIEQMLVGVQPFGGERLSGTGPKAGGPHYLQRFATERTLTINTTAVGGNASLLELSE